MLLSSSETNRRYPKTFNIYTSFQSIHAHKLILACSSDVFKAMFYGLLSEFPHRYSNFDHPSPNNKSKRAGLDEDEEQVSSSLGSVPSSVSSSVSSLSPESGRHSAADAEEEYEESEGFDQERQRPETGFGFHKKIHNVHVAPPTKTRYAATELSMFTDRR